MSEPPESARQRRFRRLGLVSDADFVLHLPLRYEDNTRISPIATLRAPQYAQIEGRLSDPEIQNHPRRQLGAWLEDGSGRIRLRWLHFYPGQLRQLQTREPVRALGEVRTGFQGLELVHPRIRSAQSPLPCTLTPVYATTEGLSQPMLRTAIDEALNRLNLPETLPDEWLQALGFMRLDEAIRFLHHPPAQAPSAALMDKTHPAWQRVKFDELLAQQLALAQARARRRSQRAWPLDGQAYHLEHALRARLPFTLTDAQERVVAEIGHDLRQPWPMHRLLQGDVGSGKTIVAALAGLQAIASGAQVALMAPTELLGEQHFDKLTAWFEPLGVSCFRLHGRQRAAQRRDSLKAIADGSAQFVVGTQALIQEQVRFYRLGLVILDEQHRFGVGQRLALSRKGEEGGDEQTIVPHQLNMSATPIPRSLAMSFLADMDISVIDKLPPGRSPVTTRLVEASRRDEVIDRLQEALAGGRQAYWVCPLVEESETLQLQTAIDTHRLLQALMPKLRVGLVHGRMSSEEKHQVMQAFRDQTLDLLVATTVIEVGVDVPNASLMVIEHAERFGLAQLHQLRGRVGRGSVQSVCVLMYESALGAVARDRLKAMYETQDGFEIARRDLAQRGPGEFLGVRQSGRQLLHFADVQEDDALLALAREYAVRMRADYPGRAEQHRARWMHDRQDFLRS